MWEGCVVFCNEFLRGFSEVTHTCVIAKAFPCFEKGLVRRVARASMEGKAARKRSK
jgi:hypothetical protein